MASEPIDDGVGTGEALPSASYEQRLSKLAEAVNSLEQKLKESQTGVWARVQRWGSLVGLVGGTCAMVLTLFTLFSKPDSSVAGGPDVKFSYDYKAKTVTLEWTLSVRNDGYGQDTITAVHARLRPEQTESSPFQEVAFHDSQIRLVESGQMLPVPFNVMKDSSRNLQAFATSEWPPDTVPENEDFWQFTVDLVNRNGQILSNAYRFYLTLDNLREIKRSGQDWETGSRHVSRSPAAKRLQPVSQVFVLHFRNALYTSGRQR